jgi:DNA anti-recombination protein RmuC
MFNIFQDQKMQRTLNEYGEKLDKLCKEVRDIRAELEKVDIKAMEAQKSYRAKLKRLTGDVEKEETETNKNPSVFLKPDGTFI